MKSVLIETENILQEKHKEFIGNVTGDLRRLLEDIWSEKFKYEKSSVNFEYGRYNEYIPELENRGFMVTTGAKWGYLTMCVAW